MPAARAASSREAPSSTRARASIRREAAVSRHRLASRRSPTAPGSFRAIATVMTPPLIGHTADQPRRAPRGSERDDGSAIRAVGMTSRQLLPAAHGELGKPNTKVVVIYSAECQATGGGWTSVAVLVDGVAASPAS